MNILIINHYAGSDKYGMEFRPFYFGRELVKQGHAVTVIAAGYSHLRRKNPDVCADFTEEWIEGIRYVWMKTPAYRKNDLRRLLQRFPAQAETIRAEDCRGVQAGCGGCVLHLSL